MLWDLTTGEAVDRLERLEPPYFSRTSDGRLERGPTQHFRDPIVSLAFAPGDRLLAAGTENGSVIFWSSK